MGGAHGGRYAIGLAFLILALLMPFHLEWSPLTSACSGRVCLVAIARHLRRFGAEAGG
jgi:hypothetical protein